MIKFLIINSIAVYITASLLSGVQIRSYWTALGVAVLLGLVNIFVKPVLTFISFPFIIISLGLFIFVINAFLLVLIDAMVDGLKIKSFGWALIFSIILSILNTILHSIF